MEIFLQISFHKILMGEKRQAIVMLKPKEGGSLEDEKQIADQMVHFYKELEQRC